MRITVAAIAACAGASTALAGPAFVSTTNPGDITADAVANYSTDSGGAPIAVGTTIDNQYAADGIVHDGLHQNDDMIAFPPASPIAYTINSPSGAPGLVIEDGITSQVSTNITFPEPVCAVGLYFIIPAQSDFGSPTVEIEIVAYDDMDQEVGRVSADSDLEFDSFPTWEGGFFGIRNTSSDPMSVVPISRVEVFGRVIAGGSAICCLVIDDLTIELCPDEPPPDPPTRTVSVSTPLTAAMTVLGVGGVGLGIGAARRRRDEV